jgi:hypothetical protein
MRVHRTSGWDGKDFRAEDTSTAQYHQVWLERLQGFPAVRSVVVIYCPVQDVQARDEAGDGLWSWLACDSRKKLPSLFVCYLGGFFENEARTEALRQEDAQHFLAIRMLL